MESGSDTETDDELHERVVITKESPVDAPASSLPYDATLSSEGAVMAENDAVDAAQCVEAKPFAQPQESHASDQGTAKETTTPAVQPPPQPPFTAPARFVDSDDDEPPQFHATVSVPTQGPLALYPATHVAPPVLPKATQFKSPFSSLAAQYQPPPQPVVGAPPASYVPLRYPPVYGGPPVSYAPVPPMHRTPTIPCTTCSRVLPDDGSPIPLDGHDTCSCCRRYFPSLVVREGEHRRYCSACVTPLPAAPRAGLAPVPHARTELTSICGRCMRPLKLNPPPPGKGIQCHCCRVTYEKYSFQKKKHRRSFVCESCMSGRTPSDEKHLQRFNKEETKRRKAERKKMAKKLTASKATTATTLVSTLNAASTQNTVPQAAPTPATPCMAPGSSIPPPDVSQVSPQERKEMEVDVRNIKLARRSIRRRRRANDLRGSTRVEYMEQLQKEEISLDQKMARMRRRNPALFDWVNQNLEIKGALGIAPSEWDHPAKGKKKNKQQTQQQSKTKSKKKKAPPPQKRKASEGAEAASSKTKRARTGEAPSHQIKAAAAPAGNIKPEVKREASTSNASVRAVPSRGRRGQPIEIIDLVDSD